jgi:hypothetical protein
MLNAERLNDEGLNTEWQNVERLNEDWLNYELLIADKTELKLDQSSKDWT